MNAKKNMQERCQRRRAFTIVELVIVIAVIAILAAIIVPIFTNINDDAEAMARKVDIEGAYTAFVANEIFNEHDYLPIGDYLFLEEGTFNSIPLSYFSNPNILR